MENYNFEVKRFKGGIPKVIIRHQIVTFEMRARKVINEYQSLPLKYKEMVKNEIKGIGE